jgi:hypothetical protein
VRVRIIILALIIFILVCVGSILAIFLRNNYLSGQALKASNRLLQFHTQVPYDFGVSFQGQNIVNIAAYLMDKKLESNDKLTLTLFVPQRGIGKTFKLVSQNKKDLVTILKDNTYAERQVYTAYPNSQLFKMLIPGRQIILKVWVNDERLRLRFSSNSSFQNTLNLINPPILIDSNAFNILIGDK